MTFISEQTLSSVCRPPSGWTEGSTAHPTKLGMLVVLRKVELSFQDFGTTGFHGALTSLIVLFLSLLE